ncbi:HYR domain-containing protein [Neolewinella persica]|uniref:HYR domain-containing protein n=1 Tax=Neolewinella persica TaxID=70998 RepID=UPI0003715D72|nr:HYR domain-containing protein [Neolewinella persica]
MKTIYKFLFLFCLLMTAQPAVAQNPQPAVEWAKLYGDSLDQRPHKIKAFGDGVYVAGETTDMGQTYGTFSKFDPNTGSLIWHFRLDRASSFADFEWDPIRDLFIVVGKTLPFSSSFDNASLAVLVDDAGIGQRLREFNFVGREELTTIVRHPSAPDPSFPYYVLGGKNPGTNNPSSFDEPILLNLNISLVEKWEHEFMGPFLNGSAIEIEGTRGLVPLSSGEILILGNGSVANEGVVIVVDGLTGVPTLPLYYPDFIDFYDGVELPNGEIALVGERFQSHEGIVLIVEPANYQPVAGMIFSDIRQFREVGLGNPGTNGGEYPLFVVGDLKNNPQKFNYLHKIDYAPGQGISLEYVHHLPASAQDFGDPHLSVTPNRNRIFYADSRVNPSASTPSRDMFIGNFSLDFVPECVEDASSPHLGYTVNPISFGLRFRTKINGPDQFLMPLTLPLPFVCATQCAAMIPCTADFTFETECCEGFFTSNVTGTAPFTYQWDLNCDGIADGFGNVPSTSISFPGSGTYQVCLTVTDATGCTQTVQKAVTVVDDPPVFNCTNVVIPTDLGECFATYTPVIDITDDCTPNIRPFCTFSGQVNGTGPFTSFPKGVTTVDCVAEDNKGQLVRCQFTITVEDREKPTVSCQAPPAVTVPICDGGANVTWPAATFSDNCPMARIDSTHVSGDFFSCGRTTVTYTATDMAGNTETCSFQVVVNCECGEAGNGEMTCTDVDNQYAFSLSVNDLGGAGPGNCQIAVTNPVNGGVISNVVVTGPGPNYTVTGLIDLATAPIPTSVQLQVNLTCVCPDGTSHQCGLPVNITVPCCKEISIDNQEQCRESGTVSINLIGCNNLFDVRQVRYYISDAPCVPGAPMTLIQVSQTCRPLELAPQYHTGDVCVYAEVDMGPGAGPCRQLRTDTALVKLCSPVDGSIPDQQFCYAGTPIVPALLSLNLANPDNCAYTIQWFGPRGQVNGATGLTYQPPAISMTAGSSQCQETFTYRAEITSICGTRTVTATVRLDNNDAPTGVIKLLAPDTNPLCYGEDAALEYFRNCQEPDDRWTWQQSLDGVAFGDITTNGNQNPIFWTNRLYQDHWYRITEQNGVCPVDTVDYFLDIIDPIAITSFSATHGPVCDPVQVDMTVDWTPGYAAGDPCFFKLVWYKDGNMIHTENASAGPRTFSYVPAAGETLAGNFYVEISASCCTQTVKSPVVTLDPPMEVLLAGPCFRCKRDTIVLQGIVLNPPAGETCTYNWYDDGVLLTGPAGTTLKLEPWRDGPITFEVVCSNGCTMSATYYLKQCGPGVPVSTDALPLLSSNVYPNPTSGPITIEMETAVAFQSLQVFSIAGKYLRELNSSATSIVHEVDLSGLPAGTYVVRGQTREGELLVVRVVKE